MKVIIEINDAYNVKEIRKAIEYLEMSLIGFDEDHTVTSDEEYENKKLFLEEKVDNLFKTRTANALKADSKFYIKDILQDLQYLCRVPNLGKVCLKEIYEVLIKIGFDIRYGN